jgi:hypothetical protein
MLNPETAAPILDCSPDTVAELLGTLSERTMTECHRRTERRVAEIHAGKSRPHVRALLGGEQMKSVAGTLAAPFPYFGGKSLACETVWAAYILRSKPSTESSHDHQRSV